MKAYEVRRLDRLPYAPHWIVVFAVDDSPFVPLAASQEYATEAEAQAEADRLSAQES